MGHVDFKIPGFLMKMRAEEERNCLLCDNYVVDTTIRLVRESFSRSVAERQSDGSCRGLLRTCAVVEELFFESLLI